MRFFHVITKKHPVIILVVQRLISMGAPEDRKKYRGGVYDSDSDGDG